MLKLRKVVPLPNYRLRVEFENGEAGDCDIGEFLDKGDFKELRDKALFNQVRNTGFSAEWPNELDLSSDTLYAIKKAA